MGGERPVGMTADGFFDRGELEVEVRSLADPNVLLGWVTCGRRPRVGDVGKFRTGLQADSPAFEMRAGHLWATDTAGVDHEIIAFAATEPLKQLKRIIGFREAAHG